MSELKQHPDYEDGFFDAMHDRGRRTNCSDPYEAGWSAAMRTREMLRKNGFEQSGGEFTKSMILKGEG